MLHLVEMLGRVFVLRRIAAADMTALEAQAQVHPGVSRFEAHFAAIATGGDFLDRIQMRAGL